MPNPEAVIFFLGLFLGFLAGLLPGMVMGMRCAHKDRDALERERHTD